MATPAPSDDCQRVFILGAGFSKAAGLPLATELTTALIDSSRLSGIEGKAEWLNTFQRRLRWLEGNSAAQINVEQLFHYAIFDAEMMKMQQHLCPVDRQAGVTPWDAAEDIEHTLRALEESLVELIWEAQSGAQLSVLEGFARQLRPGDAVLTFNYDVLLEKVLSKLSIAWSHGLSDTRTDSVIILKMHGSIDWLVVPRSEPAPIHLGLRKLFSKSDANIERRQPPVDEQEYHFELWRSDDMRQLETIIKHESVQQWFFRFGIGGLGSYKPLHRLPGSGWVWAKAMSALASTREIYAVGFSMSPFDGMARLHFASVMMERAAESRSPHFVRLINPAATSLLTDYRSVFGDVVEADSRKVEDVDWKSLSPNVSKG